MNFIGADEAVLGGELIFSFTCFSRNSLGEGKGREFRDPISPGEKKKLQKDHSFVALCVQP